MTTTTTTTTGTTTTGRGDDRPASSPAMLLLAWLAVGLPLLWGVAQTMKKTMALFS